MQCRIRQADLSRKVGTMEPLRAVRGDFKIREADAQTRRTMHSEAHLLSKDISEWCREPKEFAMYLGRILDVGVPDAVAIWSELKQRRTPIRNRGALFLTMTRKDIRAKRNTPVKIDR